MQNIKLSTACKNACNLYPTINFKFVQVESICRQQNKEHKFVVRRGENILGKGDNAGYKKKKGGVKRETAECFLVK